MTLRLVVLLVLAGGVVWLRWRIRSRASADRNRSTGGMPVVPAALRGGSRCLGDLHHAHLRGLPFG